MNKYIKSFLLAGSAAGLLFVQSCTDLEEEVSDQLSQDAFGNNPEQLSALIGPLYGELGGYFERYQQLNATTDEQIVPTRGGDWKDGDAWKRLYQHTWNPSQDDGPFNGLWTWVYNNSTAINRQLANPAITDKATIAELKTLRAFYHYIAMDNFGNVIIAETVGAESPEQKTRAEVYAWVEKELLAALPDLPSTVGGVQYGRMNKYVAHMILAKMYLNAQVYTGTPQWAKAIEQADLIINSNKYTLATDFLSNFSISNQTSPEIILATPFDKSKRGGMNIQMRTLHYLNQQTYNIGTAPWNGYATLAEFYNSFEDKDVRKKMWIVGQQYKADGTPLLDDGQPLIFKPEIPSFEMPAGPAARAAGVRSQKYEIQKNNPNTDQDNDFVIFRLGDVYLMRGEAHFRNGNQAKALEDINFIRAQRSVDPFTTLTLDNILAERGREMAWEYHRRQDLIRFGKYTAPRAFKDQSGDFRILFPIPTSQISLNPKLKQNPGY
ncbi:RagB/SusD family nutrient uptake outer membrane protein [Adhaeribacter rhizoryzae]|uniref:RagB/SusD family nutrient uptake outer membrane protein n=1 Tax=Adhaeribacter rhizoryzae TaxID=2607907 RepID=A0A5M6D278_9BACT|nr:RagB/SusD family nutrient uptake outer membrane protein [Adhaeribacter rhizoryzae]KAA5541594.1 RagB/SusD family nutrient uptake outer membrane protein [Adhaeribacter rhizoryzae]